MFHSFDTYDAIKSFVKGGMKTELAEAVVKTIVASRDTDLSHLATKSDLAEIKTELMQVKIDLSADIANVRGEIKDTKNDILKWVIGMNIATISILAALFKLFAH